MKCKLAPISAFGKIVTGKTPDTKNKSYIGDKYLFITPNELHDGFMIDSTERKLSVEGLESIVNNTVNEGIHILVGCIGWDMGNVGIVEGKCAFNQQINAITDISDGYNPYYIYYLLSGKKELFRKVAGVTRTPILNKSSFENIEVPVLEKKEQDKIAWLLKSIDEKINLNKKKINTLETMAKTLYDYWFVQFDFPDANGQPYKTSGGKMEWNETLSREIPAGWEVVRLADYCSLQRGVTYGKGDSTNIQQDGYEPILRANNIQNHELNFDSLVYLPKALIDKNQYLKEGDILIAMSSGSMEHIGKVARAFYNLNYGFGAFCSKMSPLNDTGKQYIYYYIISDEFQLYIHNMCLGTNIRNLTNDHILNSKLCKIPEKVLSKFESKIVPIHKKQAILKQENIQLSCFRDFLLPMLMNGQVTFRK